MRKIFTGILLAVCLSGCMSAQTSIAPGFQVTIVDAMTKQPLAGAVATVYADANPENSDRETAGGDGRVRVSPLQDRALCLPHCHAVTGTVSVRFWAQGYSAIVIPMAFVESDYIHPNRPVELQHAPAPQ
jgi:hypothetical protein